MGIIFVRGKCRNEGLSDRTINHELIHTAQIRETGYIGFYLIYLAEWLWRLLLPGNAYRQISFEQEAYKNEGDADYLNRRPHFAMWRTSMRRNLPIKEPDR